MTWKKFKKIVESKGVRDEDEIRSIDCNCCEVNVTVEADPEDKAQKRVISIW